MRLASKNITLVDVMMEQLQCCVGMQVSRAVGNWGRFSLNTATYVVIEFRFSVSRVLSLGLLGFSICAILFHRFGLSMCCWLHTKLYP